MAFKAPTPDGARPGAPAAEAGPNATLTAVPGLLTGRAELGDERGRTGCTVILCPEGAVASYYCPGSAPGSRETDLLRPESTVAEIQALLFSGGSAFGLNAAAGVVEYLAQKGLGFKTPYGPVPIVPAAVVYDLNLGGGLIPTAELAGLAAERADAAPVPQGNCGAGAGASSGKLAGFGRAMKTGQGSAALKAGRLWVGALTVVNALGQIVDPDSGRIIAGARDRAGRLYQKDDLPALLSGPAALGGPQLPGPGHTVISLIGVSARLSKLEAFQVARMAAAGLARAVYPANLSGDGDLIFVMATGRTPPVPVDLAGTLAAEVLSRAIVNAARAAGPFGGLPGLAAGPAPEVG